MAQRGAQLWHCLLSLLADPNYEAQIKWVDADGTFEISDRDAVAKSWSQYSPKSSSDPYGNPVPTDSSEQTRKTARDSLMRVIRYYKKNGDHGSPVLVKAKGHYRYRFIRPIVELTGYTVEEFRHFNAQYDRNMLRQASPKK